MNSGAVGRERTRMMPGLGGFMAGYGPGWVMSEGMSGFTVEGVVPYDAQLKTSDNDGTGQDLVVLEAAEGLGVRV